MSESDYSTALTAIANERERQKTIEGFSTDQDDGYLDNQLSRAAHAYTDPCISKDVPASWPWRPEWWKPKTYRENLVRAGALIAAEIERLDRITPPQ